MKRIVIGTAGHIDHGKTALIKALTGIDCDRLKVEKERGITTELGFAHYRFDNDLVIGIVDVPGHERFVRHMVAGAWGIDLCLLVVAADEGVMPQTREHMDICELLGLKRGIVAITKIDLVDEEVIELAKEDVKDFLKDRSLKDAPVIAVSAATGENIEVLKDTIKAIAEGIEGKVKEGIFRLPVDRVFSLKGLGTVVTGTCISGSIKVGEEIEIYPSGKRARIRNIQAYHENVVEATAGTRVALNLQGIEKAEITRGAIIGRPGTLILSERVDVSFKYLKMPLKPIKTNTILRFHIATTLEEARLVLQDRDTVAPGEEVFAQLVFPRPIVALAGDRFIVRGPYLIQTIGGGVILDISPVKHKRGTEQIDTIYATLTSQNVDDIAEYHILKGGYSGIKMGLLSTLLAKDQGDIGSIVERLVKAKKIRPINHNLIHMSRFDNYKEMIKTILVDFHKKNPIKIGLSKEELRQRLPKVDYSCFQAALDEAVSQGIIEVDKDRVRLKEVVNREDNDIEAIKGQVITRLLESGLTPPSLKELATGLKLEIALLKEVMERLIYEGNLIKIKADLYFHREVIDKLKQEVVEHIKEKGGLSPNDFKALFNVSRKYMIPLLEYLDEIRLTIRTGDIRVLRGNIL